MSEQELIQVQNLVDHVVVIPDLEMHRRYEFQPYESKKVDKETLRRLAYRPGVLYLFRNTLSVKDKELAREFGVPKDAYEHEYQWSQTDIDNCLTSGTLDELLDALDFAPEGIVETLAQRAVDLEINDVNKRKAITDKTGKDINSMIKNLNEYNNAMKNENDGVVETKPSRRRASKATDESASRRVQE